MNEALLYAVKDSVATITLNRPQVLNALDADMIELLRSACERARDDAAVRVIVLRGNGAAFLAGGDVAMFHANLPRLPRMVEKIARELHHDRLRAYSADDVTGVEVAGAVKNVMAIAAGVSDGLGLGLSARAALITRGLAEMTRLGVALGGRAETFMGLAGAGDLILTCTGDLSRNRRVGLALARGASLAEVLAGLGHTAEGVHTARSVANLAAGLKVDMPITRAVCRVLDDPRQARAAVQELLSREQTTEY